MKEEGDIDGGLKGTSVGFIGCGNMGGAILSGITTPCEDGGGPVVMKEQILVSCPSETSRARVSEAGFRVTPYNADVVQKCNFVWLCVKPGKIDGVLRDATQDLIVAEGHEKALKTINETVFISVAAGVSVNAMEESLKEGFRENEAAMSVGGTSSRGSKARGRGGDGAGGRIHRHHTDNDISSNDSSSISEVREEMSTGVVPVAAAAAASNLAVMASAETGLDEDVVGDDSGSEQLPSRRGENGGQGRRAIDRLDDNLSRCRPRVVRVMPNTPAAVLSAACAYCANSHASPLEVLQVQTMLTAIGVAIKVDESKMNAVTGVSGSGPAFVALFVEAMADGGVLAGLPRATALRLAAATVRGTAELILKQSMHPGVLKDAVCSPGGTTITGVRVLEQGGLRGTVMGAVVGAAERANQLGAKKTK